MVNTKNKQANKAPRNEVKTIVRSMINSRAEHKYYTFTPVTAISSATAGTVYNVTRDLVEGLNVEQRSGRKVQPTHTEMRFSIFLPTAGVAGATRLLWIVDSQNIGVLPSVSDILDTATFTSAYSLSNVATNRFQVMADLSLSHVVGGANQHQSPVIIRKRVSPIYYNGSTAVNTANGRGAHFLLILAESSLATSVVTVDFAMRYTDM